MSWDILPKANLQYFLQKLKTIFDSKADNADIEGSKTVTGNPLTITDASPLKAEKIEIGLEPKQDLHGYNSVWVGGAGKNKLPLTVAGIKAANSGVTWNGNVGTLNGMTFTINTDSDGNVTDIKCVSQSTTSTSFVLFEGSLNVSSGSKFNLSANRNNNTFDCTVTNDGTDIGYISGNSASTADVTLDDTTVTKVNLYFNSRYTDTITIYPMIHNSTDDATFEPYTNISPITGYTSISADRCGKNIFDATDRKGSYDIGFTSSFDNATQRLTCTGKWYGTWIIRVKQNTNYHITRELVSYTRSRGINVYPSDGVTVDAGTLIAGIGIADELTFNSGSNKFVAILVYAGDSTSGTTIQKIQIEEGSSYTEYNAFNGSNVTVTFGQTVYGGKLTILQDGSADVYCDTGFGDLGSPNWKKATWANTPVFVSDAISDAEAPAEANVADAICENYNVVSRNVLYYNGTIDSSFCISASKNIVVRDTILGSLDATAFKSAVNGVKVVYKLATPFTIHLSSVETLTLLQGLNNVWTDGTTLSLTYQPDNVIGEAKIYSNEAAEIVAKEYTTETDTTDTTPYLYRAGIANGDRCYLEKIVGASFGVNQLVQNGNFANGTTEWDNSGGASASVSNNVLTLTSSGTTDKFLVQNINSVAGHKYLVAVTGYSSRAHTSNREGGIEFYYGGASNYLSIVFTTTKTTYYKIISAVSNDIPQKRLYSYNGVTSYFSNIEYIDLTQYFGASIADKAYTMEQTTAGSGIAWLKSYGFFTESYYPYNAGSLESVQTSGKVNVGFNQWDEEWEIGDIDANTGAKKTGNYFISKNYIQVLSGNYYIKFGNSNAYGFIYKYNKDKQYLGYINRVANQVFEIPQDTSYILFLVASYGTTYNHDICINISKTTGIPKNGDYVPYECHTTQLQNIELRGVPTLSNNLIVYDGDVENADGSVDRKYTKIALPSSNWAVNSSSSINWIIQNTISDSVSINNNDTNIRIVCSHLISRSANELVNNMFESSYCDSIAIISSNRVFVVVSKTKYSTVADFESYVSNNNLQIVYELATPTTEQTSPIQNPQIYNSNGTEQFIDNRTVPIPVGHESRYVDLPQWMEEGYVEDLRNRVDETIVKKLNDSLVGNYSGNLFDELYPDIDNGVHYKGIFVGNGMFTLSTDAPLNSDGKTNLFLLSGNVTSGASTSTNGVSKNNSKTVESSEGYVTIGYRLQYGINPQNYNTILNKGIQPTYYESYIPTNKELWEMIKALQNT